MFKKKDQFLFLVAASVVISSAFLIIAKHITADTILARVEGAKIYKADTAAELMRLLRLTVDDGGQAELQQLKKDASGL